MGDGCRESAAGLLLLWWPLRRLAPRPPGLGSVLAVLPLEDLRRSACRGPVRTSGPTSSHQFLPAPPGPRRPSSARIKRLCQSAFHPVSICDAVAFVRGVPSKSNVFPSRPYFPARSTCAPGIRYASFPTYQHRPTQVEGSLHSPIARAPHPRLRLLWVALRSFAQLVNRLLPVGICKVAPAIENIPASRIFCDTLTGPGGISSRARKVRAPCINGGIVFAARAAVFNPGLVAGHREVNIVPRTVPG